MVHKLILNICNGCDKTLLDKLWNTEASLKVEAFLRI